MATLEDLEARVAALEAAHADYRAVLAAVNALGATQRDGNLLLRDHGEQLRDQGRRLDALETVSGDTNQRVRSLEEHMAEMKDLLVRAFDQKTD